jgi:hypothetical protein
MMCLFDDRLDRQISGKAWKWMLRTAMVSFLPLVLLSCAGRTINDYLPNSSQEEEIKAALIAFETAWNTHEEKAVLALLDDDFIMWVGSKDSRKIVFSKGTFGFSLRDILIKRRDLSLGMPEILVKDGEATARMAMLLDARGMRTTFRLINRGGAWLILEWEF